MGQLKYINERPKVRVSSHYDPAQPWAREPRLTPMATPMHDVRRSRRRQLVIEIAVISFGLGWAAHTLILG